MPNVGEVVERQELSFIVGGNAKWCNYLGSVWQFLIKLNIILYDPAIAFLSIYPNELKTYIYPKTYTRMFIAALFVTAKTWKQPRCPSAGEWINKLWYIQTMGYYSALKTNTLSSHEETWRNLKCILLSERSQSEKATYYRFQLYDLQEKAKL